MTSVAVLGHPPPHWKDTKLKYILRSKLAYGVLKPDRYEGPDYVSLIRINDMDARGIDATSLEHISPAQSKEYSRTIVREGDLLLSVVGSLGKVMFVSREVSGCNLSRAIARIQLSSSGVNPGFIYFFLNSNIVVEWIDEITTGTAQRVLNLDDLANLRIPLPPVSEQAVIAEVLADETTKADALSAKYEKLIALLEEKRLALITQAVTKGLDPTAMMKDSGIEWLGRIPAHWSVQKVSQRYSVQLGKMLDEKRIRGRHLMPLLA